MKKQSKSSMKRIGLMLSAALVAAVLMPAAAFAAPEVIFERIEGFRAMQGGDDVINLTARSAAGGRDFKIVLTADTSNISVESISSTYTGGLTHENIRIGISIDKRTSVGEHTLTAKAIAVDGSDDVIGSRDISYEVTRNMDSFSSLGGAAFDVDYSISGGSSLIAGQTQTLQLSLFNRGNTVIKNARISLTLPEGLSIASGAATVNAGYLSIGKTYVAEYPIAADRDLESKSYPVTVRIAGLNSSNSEVSVEETVYVPLAGTGGSGALDLEILNVKTPESVSAGSDFSVSFDVKNKGEYDAVNVKAELRVPEGVFNKTKNVFLIDRLAGGASQTCTVTLNARQGGEYALFEISAGSADGTQTVSQYGGTMVRGGGGGTNPQLMVSAYSYGGQPVRAGGEFILSLTLNNTSSGTALQNIKVTVTSDDSAFLPVGTSNAFYVPSIAPDSSLTHEMRLAAKKDAEQRTSTVTVAMSYEDSSGGTYTASDIISIPVIQETRLVIDDILDPGYLTADQMGYLNVNYYNMGKTQLSNLRVTAEGDFTVEGSATMYVGNMTSGKSDYYSINFFPNGPGPLNGKVIFTFEDAAGDEQIIEKPFTFQVGEAMVWEEDPNMPQPEMPAEGMSTWKTVGILLAGAAAVFGIVRYRKRKKLIRDEEFDLNE
ncbi:MAG: CARDB domain-containing protein [Eubacteriales bacterium]|nr:CARDB domain-containing protein [Eubacteriales bacterium]